MRTATYKHGKMIYRDLTADEIAEMGRRAKKRVAEEYTWDKICRQYEEVFVGENQ